MNKRRLIYVEVERYCIDSLFGVKSSPDDVIEKLQRYKKSYEGRDIYFTYELAGYDGGYDIHLWESRLENDEEFNKRVKEEDKKKKVDENAREKKEARELKEYERLKKKFGNKTKA